MKELVLKLDYYVARFFHKVYLWGGEFANGGMKALSLIAEAGILFLAVGVILAMFKRTRKIGVTVLLAVAIGFVATNIVLKNIISRTRPFNTDSQYWLWWLDAGSIAESGYSFPSGHTTASTAFALAIFLTTNKKYSWPVLLFPVLMASSRIYLMVHYFSDCLGGVFVGSVCAILAWLIVRWIYVSKSKFCVWMREYSLFKKYNIATNTESVKTTKSKSRKKLEYKTQKEEADIIEKQTLIQRDIGKRGFEDGDLEDEEKSEDDKK